MADDAVTMAVEQIKATIAESGRLPVLLKLGPTQDVEALRVMVESALEAGVAGVAGFVVANTIPFDKRRYAG